jgi:phosphoglycolate phosphatase
MHSSTAPIRLVLFDLDGTLVDSRSDISAAMNATLARLGFGSLRSEQIIGYVGDGVPQLVERSLRAVLDRTPTAKELAEAGRIYRAEYTDRCLDTTQPYAGIRQMLQQLIALPLAVVTNNPTALSEKVLSGLNLREYFCRVVGGDATERRKPDPQPLLEVADQLGIAPLLAVMVGDSCNDIRAGRGAGMRTVGCAWGFRGAAELRSCSADRVLASPLLLPAALGIG